MQLIAAVRTAGRSASTDDSSDVVATLDLYDPLHVTHVNFGAVEHELTRDISAPLAFVSAEVDRNNWRDFLRPGTENGNMGLRMLQPYQPGKIPVVLVHGLLSDKFTWIQMVNDLRSVPWINERFQIWTFQYYTGQPFLRSGAELRQALSEAIHTFDPQHMDPAMGQMVLVGHSMGGLVSKLQVTSSQNILWDAIASRPFNEVAIEPGDRQQVSQLFFFEPLPSVRRVLFIGTPHQGSFWADNSAGRLGSTLVSMPKDRVELLQTLVKNNPDVFSKYLRKGIPTSIDLLRPDSPLLLGMQRLPVSPAVRLHSIVGTGSSLSDGTPADGIVPVSSRHAPRLRQHALRQHRPQRIARSSRYHRGSHVASSPNSSTPMSLENNSPPANAPLTLRVTPGMVVSWPTRFVTDVPSPAVRHGDEAESAVAPWPGSRSRSESTA